MVNIKKRAKHYNYQTTPPGQKLNNCMAFDDNYNLNLLYGLAGNQPYRALPSHVVPEAKFEISYPNIKSEFKLDTIPQLKK